MASKKMDKLKEAGASLDKLFSGASETAPEGSEPVIKIRKGVLPKKDKEGAQKAQKKVFSFRAPEDQVDSWRVWADAKGLKVDELGTLALTEYIKKHSLTADQKQIYELKMAQKK